MKLTKLESERVKEYIVQIIRDECDGTYSNDIESWVIAESSCAPERLRGKLFTLVDTITESNNH